MLTSSLAFPPRNAPRPVPVPGACTSRRQYTHPSARPNLPKQPSPPQRQLPGPLLGNTNTLPESPACHFFFFIMSSAPAAKLVSWDEGARPERLTKDAVSSRPCPSPLGFALLIAGGIPSRTTASIVRAAAAPTLSTPPLSPTPPLRRPSPLVSSQIPGVLGGFVSAYGMWAVLTKDAKQKLPHTVSAKGGAGLAGLWGRRLQGPPGKDIEIALLDGAASRRACRCCHAVGRPHSGCSLARRRLQNACRELHRSVRPPFALTCSPPRHATS